MVLSTLERNITIRKHCGNKYQNISR